MTLWIPDPPFYFPMLNFFCHVRFRDVQFFWKRESDSKRRYDDKWPDLVARNVVAEASELSKRKNETPPLSFFIPLFYHPCFKFATFDAARWHSGVQGHPGRAAGAPVRLCSRNFFLLSPKQVKKLKLSEHGPFDRKGPERASEPEVDWWVFDLAFCPARVSAITMTSRWRHDDDAEHAQRKNISRYYFCSMPIITLLWKLLYCWFIYWCTFMF